LKVENYDKPEFSGLLAAEDITQKKQATSAITSWNEGAAPPQAGPEADGGG
jgi:hypothetical protein